MYDTWITLLNKCTRYTAVMLPFVLIIYSTKNRVVGFELNWAPHFPFTVVIYLVSPVCNIFNEKIGLFIVGSRTQTWYKKIEMNRWYDEPHQYEMKWLLTKKLAKIITCYKYIIILNECFYKNICMRIVIVVFRPTTWKMNG